MNVEQSKDLDWEYLWWGDARRADWVASSLCLAHELLGARLDGIPATERAKRLPRWLAPTMLRQWSTQEHYILDSQSMAYSLRHPAHLLKSLRLRWPNPIQATARVGGPFNELPRLPFQLWECVLRTAHFITQVPTLVRQGSLRPVGGVGNSSGGYRRGKKAVGDQGAGRPNA